MRYLGRKNQTCVLTKDVINPDADRRSKAWNKEPLWTNGTKFVVITNIYGPDEKMVALAKSLGLPEPPQREHVEVRQRGLFCQRGLYRPIDASTVPTLMAALTPVPLDLEDVITDCAGGAMVPGGFNAHEAALTILITKGLVSFDQVRAALKEWVDATQPR